MLSRILNAYQRELRSCRSAPFASRTGARAKGQSSMRGINRVRAFIPPDVWDRLHGPKKSVPPEPNAEERKPRYRTENLTGGCTLVHLGSPHPDRKGARR